jgi:hypothetical protein
MDLRFRLVSSSDRLSWLSSYTVQHRNINDQLLPYLNDLLGDVDLSFTEHFDQPAEHVFDLFFDNLLFKFNLVFPVSYKNGKPNSNTVKARPNSNVVKNGWYGPELAKLKAWLSLLYDLYKAAATTEERNRIYSIYTCTKRDYRLAVDDAKRRGVEDFIRCAANPYVRQHGP